MCGEGPPGFSTMTYSPGAQRRVMLCVTVSGRRTEEGKTAESANRRSKRLKVSLTEAELADIAGRAAAARLPVAVYLRRLGLGWEPKSTLDLQAVLALAKVNADQGRLGGLLKLWLSERPDQGASTVEARRLLGQIEAVQAELRRLMDRLS
jgi:hypothetical protein